MAPCVWEARESIEPRNNRGEATAFWKSDAALDTPDLQSFMVEAPYASPQAAKVALPRATGQRAAPARLCEARNPAGSARGCRIGGFHPECHGQPFSPALHGQ